MCGSLRDEENKRLAELIERARPKFGHEALENFLLDFRGETKSQIVALEIALVTQEWVTSGEH
jgi:hypothetical protein